MSSEPESSVVTVQRQSQPESPPRLLYAGEVDVQAYCHGSLLLYRLLQDYPKDRLHILETSPGGSEKERRIPGVAYEHLPLPGRFLFHNRFTRLYAGLLPQASSQLGRELCDRLCSLPWDALITVAHGHSWIPGFDLAVKLGRPVHLVVHDDWPRYTASSRLMQRRLDVEFARRYRSATSRLCVSPHMEKEYRRRYHAPGKVLYPARGEGALMRGETPRASSGKLTNPVVAFAGTIATEGLEQVLQLCARALRSLNGRLLIYGPTTEEHLSRHGLEEPNLEVRGLIPPDQMVDELSREADVLFLPMSFAPADRDMIQINFPSKLTDYTATGLPVLICAPPHSSAVQWEHDFPGCAAVVDHADEPALTQALRRLCDEPEWRSALAARARQVGNECFDPRQAQHVLHEALAAA